MAQMAPKVGIVTINYNGKAYLSDFVRSIYDLHYPNYELFLLDNASTDGSIEEINSIYPNLPFVRLSQNVGVAAGNNMGIKFFKERGNIDYILFLNPDTTHKPDFLDRLLTYANAKTMVTSRSYFSDSPLISNTTAGNFNWWRGVMSMPYYNRPDSEQASQVQEVEITSSCALLVPMNVFDAIGLMDEAYFMYYDDTDFVLRANKEGYRVIYNPHSIIYHREKASTGGRGYSALSSYYFFRNRLYMMRKILGMNYRYFLFMIVYLLEWNIHYMRFRLTGRKDVASALLYALKHYLHTQMGKVVLA